MHLYFTYSISNFCRQAPFERALERWCGSTRASENGCKSSRCGADPCALLYVAP